MRLFKALLSMAFLLTLTLNITAQTDEVVENVVEEKVYEAPSWDNDRYQIFIGGYINGGSITETFKSSYGLGLGIQKKYLFVGIFGELGDLGDVQLKTGGMSSVNYGIIGPWLGVRTNPYKKIGLYGSVKGGTGYGDYSMIEGGEENIDDFDNIHVIRPEVGAEFKIGRKLNIAGHLGYDFTSSVHEFPAIEDTDLRKLNFGITLRVIAGGR